jgi:hypothetical protein
MIDQSEIAYAAFAEQVVSKHRLCSFETHARTCYEEAFRAGWEARETASETKVDRLRAALTILYELNESGNVAGAYYEEAMDLAMDALRETE